MPWLPHHHLAWEWECYSQWKPFKGPLLVNQDTWSNVFETLANLDTYLAPTVFVFERGSTLEHTSFSVQTTFEWNMLDKGLGRFCSNNFSCNSHMPQTFSRGVAPLSRTWSALVLREDSTRLLLLGCLSVPDYALMLSSECKSLTEKNTFVLQLWQFWGAQ